MSACVHCGTLLSQDQARFCCHGCAMAHDVLSRCGLGSYVALREAALAAGAAPRPVPAITAEHRAWAAPEFLARVAADLGGGRHAIAWAVEGLHCPACTWVLERLSFIDPGIERAEVDVGRGVLRTVHHAARTDPARIATLAAQLGYRLRPWAGAVDDRQRRLAARAEALRAAIALACAVGSMQLAMNLAAGELTGDLEPRFRWYFGLGALLLALPAGTWAVGPWWRALGRALRHGRWSLDATAAAVVTVGLGASAANLVRGSNATYADAVAMFCALLLVGRLALHRIQDRLAVQASHLGGILPDEVPALDSDAEYARGQRLGGDGVVVAASPEAAVDVAVLTGESRPQPLASGQTVYAGTLLVAGTCTVRIAATGSHSRVGKMLMAAEVNKAADVSKAAAIGAEDAWWERWYGAALVLLAVAAGWWSGVDRAVAVVMAACPCAIGLALPLARARLLAAARQRGLLIRSGAALLRLRGITAAVFDKTGTLTTGQMTVVAWRWLVPEAERPLLAGAILAIERQCRHPLALAIERHVREQFLAPEVSVEEVVELPGRGVTARWAGRAMSLGPGAGGIVVRCAGDVVAEIRVTDGIRPDAPTVLAAMRRRGWRLTLASGDAPEAVRAVAQTLAISDAQAAQLPEDKARLVDARTLMVGDGVNDAAALAAAGFSVAVRGGLAAGLACADVVVTDEAAPLAALSDLLLASERLQRRERLLLAATVLYNAVAVGAAVAGWWGPLICAVGMPVSSLIAVLIATAWEPFAERND
jgi:Cu2+-exporting ATPase